MIWEENGGGGEGSGFEVFVSLPCPVLKFTFTFSLLSRSCLKYDGTEILCGYS